MMSLKSKSTWALALAVAMVTSTNATNTNNNTNNVRGRRTHTDCLYATTQSCCGNPSCNTEGGACYSGPNSPLCTTDQSIMPCTCRLLQGPPPPPPCVNRKTALTATTAAELCPNYASDPYVKIKHAWVDPQSGKGGHCGGKKTEELKLSIANGLFGGNTVADRDCTAWCVKNSEGGGHFKFDHKRECFKFRGTGMCGVEKEKEFAEVAKAQLCDKRP